LFAAARAQTIFGTILGSVSDSSGGVLPNVRIRVVNVNTNLERRAVADALGNYEVTSLPPGRYRIEVENPGFQRLVRDGIELDTRQVARVDLQLTVGDVATTVSITAEAPMVESETARISDVRSGELLRTLPLNSISIFRFTVLTPGVLGNVSGSTFSFNGSWGRQAAWTIDGVSMSDVTTGTQIGPLANNLENFEELKIDLSNNTAEHGAVGTVTMTTRSGQNQLHGSLFESHISPAFRAANPFTHLKARTVTNQYGGSIGGPVYIPKVYNGKNRTFFWFAYMDWRDSARVTDLTPTVPLAAWKQGNFSDVAAALTDPLGTTFAGNVIPANRINPVASRIQERFYPDPNFGNTAVFTAQNWRGQARPPAHNPYNRSIRIDHKISGSNTIFGRLNLQHAHGDGWLGNLPTGGQNKQIRRNRHISIVDTHVFSPQVVNEFRFGSPRDRNNFYERAFPGLPLAQQFGFQGLAPDIPADAGGSPLVRFNGPGAVQNVDFGAGARPLDTSLQFYNVLSWFRGRHSLKFGGQFLKARFESESLPAGLFGNWLFTNRYTGWAYADFLLGLPSEANRQFPNPQVRQRRPSLEFFVHDDLKIHPRITLNVGLRYEYRRNWTEANGLMTEFNVDRQALVVPNGALSQVSPLFRQVFPRINVIEAREAGVPSQALVRTDRNNFAPRLGLAWRPFGHGRSVLRAGYGIFYNVAPLHRNAAGLPFKLDESPFINPAARPELVWPLAVPATGVTPSAVTFPPTLSGRDPGFVEPYTQQWNLTLEQEFHRTGFRFSYIGTAGRLLDYTRNVNAPEPNSTPYIQKPRPLPGYAAIDFITNGASHTYHGLQIEAQRQMQSGAFYQLAYTWSKDIGDHHIVAENPFDRSRDRSQNSRFPNHRLTGNFSWELPVGRGKRIGPGLSGIAQGILGGWQLAGIVSLQTGDHINPFYSAPDIHTNIAHTTSVTPPVAGRRPDRIADGNLSSGQRGVVQWFDPGAFRDPGCPVSNPFCTGAARASAGRFGTSGVNVITGPGSVSTHLGLYKNFVIRERVKLRFEFGGTNVLNHPNWNNPGLDLANPTARARITGVGGGAGAGGWDGAGPREMHLGVRLDW
ncbi:MAG: carboxypeptidase regulatory-like domain-containing protein, partial [Bryobacteraceae bacterium]